MNTLQKTFKYLKEKNDRSDRFDIIPAVQCWSVDRRVSQLLKLGLVEKRVIDRSNHEKPITEYKITDLGLHTKVDEVKAPKPILKTIKTKEESIVKSQCKKMNMPIKPTTLWGKIVYMYDVRMSL